MTASRHLGPGSVLPQPLVYHCALIKADTCHLRNHLQSSTVGGWGVPLPNSETSQPCRVCLCVCLAWASPLLWGMAETSEVSVSGCHHRSPALPIFPIALARADSGSSQGNARVSLASASSSSPPFLGPAWPALLGQNQDQDQPANYLSKGLRLGAIPFEAKVNPFFPLL